VSTHEANAEGIALAVRLLREGKLVAFPTETVYGLGARALDAAAVARIFEAKGRPRSHPLIAHVAGEDDARALASEWSARASRLARAFWPGPLTLVVPRAAHVPDVVAGGGDSIAVRAPAHPVARALIEALGEPIAAPSANRYQTLSPTRAEHVVKSLGDRVDLVLDGGACASGIESTVVDVRGERARVLRPGALSMAALRAIEADIEVAEGVVAEDAERASPGMDARHYAPRARVVIAEGRAAAIAEAHARVDEGRVGLVLRGGAIDVRMAGIDVRVLPDAPVGYAAALFATLHALDDASSAAIVIEAVPEGEAWWPVADRLRRAAT
jgi:L-threonylcarbamoyladenylate synthase